MNKAARIPHARPTDPKEFREQIVGLCRTARTSENSPKNLNPAVKRYGSGPSRLRSIMENAKMVSLQRRKSVVATPSTTSFVCLAMVLDVYSWRIIGSEIASCLRTELLLNAVGRAVMQRTFQEVIHHAARVPRIPRLFSVYRGHKRISARQWEASATARTMR